MGLWRGRRQQRRFVALAAVLLVVGLPAMARSGATRPTGPGRLTSFEVRGNTVAIDAVGARLQVVFLTDDLFRIWMAPDGTFTDPANTPEGPTTLLAGPNALYLGGNYTRLQLEHVGADCWPCEQKDWRGKELIFHPGFAMFPAIP